MRKWKQALNESVTLSKKLWALLSIYHKVLSNTQEEMPVVYGNSTQLGFV